MKKWLFHSKKDHVSSFCNLAAHAGGAPIRPAGMGARGRLRYNRASGAPTVLAPPLPQIIQRESACKPPHLA
jgi:hypothetical protein